MSEYVLLTEDALLHLANKDKRMKELIESVGLIERELDRDLFRSLVRAIISQQISSKAADTVMNRLLSRICVTPEAVFSQSPEELQSIGISFRKAGYLREIARRVVEGELDIDALSEKSDEEVIEILDALPGIGRWTAEMLLIFTLGRENILSFDDLAIRRGLMKLYHHKELTKERFQRYRKRYHPYNTAASLYLWELSKD